MPVGNLRQAPDNTEELAMKWKLCGPAALVLCAALLASAAHATIHVVQYTPGYVEGLTGDYWVQWTGNLPTIWILQPSIPAYGPYDFDAYDDATTPPYAPATIGAILAGPSLADIVELKIVGHDGREYGAENVDQVVFNYNWGQGPALKIKAFNIHGTLGAVEGVDNHAFSIEGDFSAASIARPF
jgi:hypothetical protein